MYIDLRCIQAVLESGMIRFFRNSFREMAKGRTVVEKSNKGNKKATGTTTSAQATSSVEVDKAISLNSCGQIMLRVHARPGAKSNSITEIREEEICVAINAPPREGQANEELVSYLREVLGLRNNELCFDKGAKSRNKILLITSARLPMKDVIDKLNKNVGK